MELKDIMENIKQAKSAAISGSGERTLLVRGGIAVDGAEMSALFAEKDVNVPKGKAFRIGNPEGFMKLTSLLPGGATVSTGDGDTIVITGKGVKATMRCKEVEDFESRVKKTEKHIPIAFPELLIKAVAGAAKMSDKDVLIVGDTAITIGHSGAMVFISKIGQTLPWPVALLAKTTATIGNVWFRRKPEAGFISPATLLVKGDGTWTEFRAIEHPDKDLVDVPRQYLAAKEYGQSLTAQAMIDARELKRQSTLMAIASDVEVVNVEGDKPETPMPEDPEIKTKSGSKEKRKPEKPVFWVSAMAGTLQFRSSGGESEVECELSGDIPETKFDVALFMNAAEAIASRSSKAILGVVAGVPTLHIAMATGDKSTIVILAGLRDN